MPDSTATGRSLPAIYTDANVWCVLPYAADRARFGVGLTTPAGVARFAIDVEGARFLSEELSAYLDACRELAQAEARPPIGCSQSGRRGLPAEDVIRAISRQRHPFAWHGAGPLRRFFRALLGLDFPDPAVGQIWRAQHSGQRFRVEKVSLSEWRGGTTVRIALEFDAEGGAMWSPVLCTYATTLAQWRANLRMERRVLVAQESAYA